MELTLLNAIRTFIAIRILQHFRRQLIDGKMNVPCEKLEKKLSHWTFIESDKLSSLIDFNNYDDFQFLNILRQL